jgi:hypothetical protein
LIVITIVRANFELSELSTATEREVVETFESLEAFINVQLRIFREVILPSINNCKCENCIQMHAKISQIFKEEKEMNRRLQDLRG